MKPLKIKFAAFGSYPGEVEVDFAALSARGLFVISGDTGTGKTTVFDAMSFALFGKMPLKPADDIRSHHADAATPTFARFTFEAGGVVYVAEQSPKYERPKQVGAGTTTEHRKASLHKRDGDEVTMLASGAQDVARHISDLIGLNAEQFQRVMVLPQGEVQRFLLDKSGDREELLRQLFGGDVFEAITQELKQQRDEAADEVREVENQIREAAGIAAEMIKQAREELDIEAPGEGEHLDREGLGEQLDALRRPAKDLATVATASRAAADKATATATTALDAADRYDRADRHREKLKALAENEAVVFTAAAAAKRSAAARPVTDADDRCAAAKEAEVLAIAASDAALDELRAAGRTIDVIFTDPSPIKVATAIEQAKSAASAQRAALDERDVAEAAARGAADKLADWKQRVETNEAETGNVQLEIEGLDDELRAFSEMPLDTGALDAARRDLAEALAGIERRDGLRVAHRRALEAERNAEDVVKETMRGYLQSEAPRMAAGLRDGEPCHVCGSTEHPRPAEPADRDRVVGHEEVLQAQEHFQQTQATRSGLESDLAAAMAALGADAESDATAVETRLETTQRALAETVSAIERRNELTSKRQKCVERLGKLITAAAELSGAKEGLQQGMDDTAARFEAATTAAAGIDVSALGENDAVIGELGELCDRYQGTVEMRASSTTTSENAEKELAGVLAASSFATVTDAREALLEVVVEQEALDAEAVHREEALNAKSSLATLEEQGVSETRPDTEALTAAAADADGKARALEERHTRVEQSLRTATDAIKDYDAIQTTSAPLRERADAARLAYAVCQGSRDINLLRWVLGQQLDQVAVVASEHLRQMSNGRYTIRRDDAKGGAGAKGLDLTIDDAHTGRDRSPSTLSGGEQFQASLALALGLADVVSRAGSTRSHSPEALFIDEGFGSLDQRALDDAIDTLHGLQEQGRMVGVITHVEAMKERLHPGIVVERHADGRGSKLTVNP